MPILTPDSVALVTALISLATTVAQATPGQGARRHPRKRTPQQPRSGGRRRLSIRRAGQTR